MIISFIFSLMLSTHLLGKKNGLLHVTAAFLCFCYIHSTAGGWVICHCTGTRQYSILKITPTAITIVTDIQVNMTKNRTLIKVHPNYSRLHGSFSSFLCCHCHRTSDRHHKYFIWHQNWPYYWSAEMYFKTTNKRRGGEKVELPT